MDEYGAVVVGTGFGVLTHVRALQGAGFTVRALVGRDLTKARQRADLMGVPHVAGSLTEAIALGGIDAVAVSTPPSSHCELVLEAIAAGKHVVCEKPFAMDVGQARQMLAAAQAAGVVHLLGTEFRFGAGQAQMVRSVAAGAIGTPQLALLLLQVPTLSDHAAVIPGWWEDAAVGGGWLGAHGSHVIDQARTLMGEIEAVSATLQTLSGRPGMTADDTYTLHIRTTSGAHGILHGSCATAGPFLSLTKLTGTGGSVWDQGGSLMVDDGTGSHELPIDTDLVAQAPVPPPAELLSTAYDYWHSSGMDLHPYTRLYQALADRMAGRPLVATDPVPATFADGVVVQAVMDAAHRSSDDQGAWVEIDYSV